MGATWINILFLQVSVKKRGKKAKEQKQGVVGGWGTPLGNDMIGEFARKEIQGFRVSLRVHQFGIRNSERRAESRTH